MGRKRSRSRAGFAHSRAVLLRLLVVVLVVGGVAGAGKEPHRAGAGLSPMPYLDSSYNDALWQDVVQSWPDGFPSQGEAGATFQVSAAAGAEPSAVPSPIVLPTSGDVSIGWKIDVGGTAQWLDLSGDLGRGCPESCVSGVA